jgi:hypothetical protein
MKTLTSLALLAFATVLPPSASAARLILVAGGGALDSGAPAAQIKLKEPFGVSFDHSGGMFIVEMAQGERILRMDSQGVVRNFAGTGVKGHSGDGGSALEASFNGMHHIAFGPGGHLYIADTWNNCVRKVELAGGRVSAVAGTGQKGFSGDGGPAMKAEFGGIYSLAFDAAGENVFLADLDNRRVRAVNLKSGAVRTVAGNGKKGVPMDGSLATEAPLVDPRAATVDSKGNVYVLERGGNALRVVDAVGRIRTVINASGQKGAEGDGGEALKATMNGPKHLCVDRDDNVIIADAENNLVRKYLPRDGSIVRVAGTGVKGAAGLGGPPEKAELNRPHGVCINASGTLFITDSYNNRILKIVE